MNLIYKTYTYISVHPKSIANAANWKCREESALYVQPLVATLIKKKSTSFNSESQSFSKMEVDKLTDPGCAGMATAGSLWGRCWVGTGWCGRWQGLYTPGQTQ